MHCKNSKLPTFKNSKINTKAINTVRQSREEDETLVIIESVRETTPNKGTKRHNSIDTTGNILPINH